MRICLVCSPGGHLFEISKLMDSFSGYDVHLITYEESFLDDSIFSENVRKVYLIKSLKNLIIDNVQVNNLLSIILLLVHLVIIAIKELKIMVIEKPDIIVSTGSEIAIPTLFLGKIFKRKCIFIESLCRIKELSGTGKLVYPLMDVFIVQWPHLRNRYKKAVYQGNIVDSIKSKTSKKEKMVFVTVGTHPFQRLVRKVDEIAEKIDKRVIMQIGSTRYEPRNAEYFRFHPSYQVIKELNERAEVVVCHGGIGSIMTAIEAGTPVIAVPRLVQYKEHYDNHQLEIITFLARKGIILEIHDLDKLEIVLEKKLYKSPQYASDYGILNKDMLVQFLRELITSWENCK